jgi:hypothetical protein
MAWRSGHGKGGAVPRIEVLPPDELPAGVPAPAEPPKQSDHDGEGRFRPGNRASVKGGIALAESRKLSKLLGLWEAPEGHSYRPYARMAREWRDEHMARMAATVGGGHVGPGPASIVSSASIQLAASRWAYDTAAQTGDAQLFSQASKLANDSRQNLLAAHELCAREAKAREDSEGDDLTRQQLEFQRQLKEKQRA